MAFAAKSCALWQGWDINELCHLWIFSVHKLEIMIMRASLEPSKPMALWWTLDLESVSSSFSLLHVGITIFTQNAYESIAWSERGPRHASRVHYLRNFRISFSKPDYYCRGRRHDGESRVWFETHACSVHQWSLFWSSRLQGMAITSHDEPRTLTPYMICTNQYIYLKSWRQGGKFLEFLKYVLLTLMDAVGADGSLGMATVAQRNEHVE